MHLDQHRHAELEGDASISCISASESAGGDQQDGVGAHRARFEDLVGIDQEVLAQHRQVQAARAACRYSGAPWKNCRSVSTDRQAAPCALVVCGDLGRAEVGADHALGRAGLLDLGDHRGLAGGDLARMAPTKSRAGGCAAASARTAACGRRGAAATSSRLTARSSRMSASAAQAKAAW
jgi:hypothetical protein